MTVETAIEYASSELKRAAVPDARRDARTLLAGVLGRDLAFLVAHPEYSLAESEIELFLEAVKRRCAREPLQYILGRQEFYGLEFLVTPDVLIPRPETEALVEAAIPFLRAARDPHFCDVGIGSGCIAVSLLKHIPAAAATGLDISEPALAVASENAKRHGVLSRIRLIRSDVFSALGSDDKFDLIASNPPYVDSLDLGSLQSEVRDFEPRVALTDGGDGLSIIRRIVEHSPRHLKPGGALLIEIGFRQSEVVASMFSRGRWSDVRFLPDLSGIPRVVLAFSGVL